MYLDSIKLFFRERIKRDCAIYLFQIKGHRNKDPLRPIIRQLNLKCVSYQLKEAVDLFSVKIPVISDYQVFLVVP